MTQLKNAINWFEIPVTDFERAKLFYEQVFDYEMPIMTMGEIQMGFLNFDQQNGGIGGAIVHGDGYVPTQDGPKLYLNAGEQLSPTVDKITAAGGEVLHKNIKIDNDFGYFAVIQDTEGNLLYLHSNSP
jgi:predicted enzyme related to lactoylglutathione lyase